MFEFAERGLPVSKEAFKAAEGPLRVDLLNAQFDLRQADFSVVLLLTGDDRYGVEEVIDLLHDWLEVRGLDTHVFERPTAEERERPPFWRSWLALPARGRIGVLSGAWARGTIIDRAAGRSDEEGFDLRISHDRQFERALTDDGTLLLKFWLHLPKAEHQRRLERAEAKPDEHWWVEPVDHEIYRSYDAVLPVGERYLRKTDTPEAPWFVIDGTDARSRDLAIMQRLLAHLTARLNAPRREPGARVDAEPSAATGPPAADPGPGPARTGIEAPEVADVPGVAVPGALDTVDLSLALGPEEYEGLRTKYMRRLHRRSRKAWAKGISTVLVLEGWDAAGKGSVIRRIARAVDAALYQVIPISAPTDEEKDRHYLWRFWRRLPRAGRMVIFDRSWYGRVLVERVEGFARPEEWRRAYAEINDFEEQLVEHGIVLRKFWLHISPEEQLRRFEARALTPYKKYKFTAEDARNRSRWHDYEAAVNEMITRTSTELAPWHLISANDKPNARISVLREVSRALKRVRRTP